MHNSLFIRDLLKRTNNDPLRLDRRNPHRAVCADPDAQPGAGEFALVGAWAVCSPEYPEVVDDLTDFLQRLGVAVTPEAEQTITVALTSELTARGCRLTCAPGAVLVEGGDVAGLWAGVAWLEWEMRTRRGAILPESSVTREAAWPVQISQGPWGGNYSVPDFSPEYLSDDAFRLYAHYGVNSMMIYGDLLCYINSEHLPELNCPDFAANLAMLKDAAQRAARYGVQFSYVVVGPKLRPEHPVFVQHPEVLGGGVNFGSGPLHTLCSSHPTVHALYTETFSRLFREVPELAGLILIVGGESFYHCHIWSGDAGIPCERCAKLTLEEDLAQVLEVVQQAVTTAQPAAWVAAWAYNVYGWKHPDREPFVRQLPDGVGFYHHIEKDQLYEKDGYRKHIWDYSVDFTGPSDDMRRLSAIARETGHPLFVKTETGIGLEVFQFPYVPAMQRLAEKWQHVRELAPCGVQQSWLFYGMFGSRAEELGLWAAYGVEFDSDDFLRRMAVRDFGPQTAELALASWGHMSAAVGHIPCVTLHTYYIGPSYLGPAHPLVPKSGDTIPEVFHGYLFYLQELEESFSRKSIEEVGVSMVMDSLGETAHGLYMQWDGPSDGWDIVVREYTLATQEAHTAWTLLQQAVPLTRTAEDRANLHEELLLTELVYRTMLACASTIRFLLARRAYEKSGDFAALAEMKQVALVEKENALGAVHIYQDAPWLDLTERTDGRYAPCVEMLAEKVRWIDRFLAEIADESPAAAR